jgi:hypothetical protein
MNIEYDSASDTLIISIDNASAAAAEQPAEFTIGLSVANGQSQVVIGNASYFLDRALATGIKVAEPVPVPRTRGKLTWYDADSSMVQGFGYDPDAQLLEVAFHRTAVYQYEGVPPHVFEELRDASSKGAYMREQIIGSYRAGRKGSKAQA